MRKLYAAFCHYVCCELKGEFIQVELARLVPILRMAKDHTEACFDARNMFHAVQAARPKGPHPPSYNAVLSITTAIQQHRGPGKIPKIKASGTPDTSVNASVSISPNVSMLGPFS